MTLAADPADPLGARITSDLMLGGTITQVSAKLCGGEDVTGRLQVQASGW